RHRREYVLRGLMTGLGVSRQVVHRDESFDFGPLIFRAGAAGGLRSELSLPGRLCQDLFLTVHMKNELARRAHHRLGAEIEVGVAAARTGALSSVPRRINSGMAPTTKTSAAPRPARSRKASRSISAGSCGFRRGRASLRIRSHFLWNRSSPGWPFAVMASITI